MNRNAKEQNVTQLQELFAGSQAVIATHYRGLTVAQMNALRVKLDEVDSVYRVCKNTLAIRASTETDAAVLADDLVGPTGLIFVNGDPAAAAKAIVDFAKENDKLVVTAGALGGKRLDAKDIEALSKLPSREQMLGMFVGVLAAPMRNFVGVLAAVPRSVVQVLAAIEKQKSEAA